MYYDGGNNGRRKLIRKKYERIPFKEEEGEKRQRVTEFVRT